MGVRRLRRADAVMRGRIRIQEEEEEDQEDEQQEDGMGWDEDQELGESRMRPLHVT